MLFTHAHQAATAPIQSVKVCAVTETTETKRTDTMMPRPKHDYLGRVADRPGADAMPTKRPRPNHARSATQQVQKHSPADFFPARERSSIERRDDKVILCKRRMQ